MLEAGKHPRTESSIWHIRDSTISIVGIWSSAEAVPVLPISSIVPVHTVNNTGKLCFRVGAVGYVGTARSLFRKINWITSTERAKPRDAGSSLCTEFLVNRKYIELHSARQKGTILRGSVFPRLMWITQAHTRERSYSLRYSSIETGKFHTRDLEERSVGYWNVHVKVRINRGQRSAITLQEFSVIYIVRCIRNGLIHELWAGWFCLLRFRGNGGGGWMIACTASKESEWRSAILLTGHFSQVYFPFSRSRFSFHPGNFS